MVFHHFIGPKVPLNAASIGALDISVLSYNVLLPNSVDGWWTYKMYDPPLFDEERKTIASWDYRRELIQKRVAAVDASVVCFQEVCPESFDQDFHFMEELGYDGKEMFKKGRFRPATFWKSSQCELVSTPVHKDRTLLTAFRCGSNSGDDKNSGTARNWYVLNCHLQAGSEASRRVRQINEGMRSILTLAKKLKEPEPAKTLPIVVCGDFNGGAECGAVRYLEDGVVDEKFIEDGAQVTSSRKELPLSAPLVDVMNIPETGRPAPPTLVVSELISVMVEGDASGAYQKPVFKQDMMERLARIHSALSSGRNAQGDPEMTADDVEAWLKRINGKVGRGSEFREAVKQMRAGNDEQIAINSKNGGEDEEDEQEPLNKEVPRDGSTLTLDGFRAVYLNEMRQGKFWGVAHDMAVLNEPLPSVGTFEGRYDRMYCSSAAVPCAVMDFLCKDPCPNETEPSDHLPIAAAFKAA
ncbi:hypothetical protein ACA910_019656 [Epithemia clementina (nom. ined.)]